MTKWWSSPFARFFLLGLMLWLGEHYIEWRDSYRIASPSEELLNLSYQEWARRSGEFPNAQQKYEIQQSELQDSILLAEALRRELYRDDPVVYQRLLKNAEFLGIEGDETQKIATAMTLELHKNDELIRRRLVQRMEAVGRAQAYPIAKPDDSTLRIQYEAQRERWKIAPRLEICHIYFSADKPGIESRITAAKEKLRQNSLSDDEAVALGDRFLMGSTLSLLELRKLRDIFGDEFTQSLMAIVAGGQEADAVGVWSTPLRSAYGVHIVKILKFEKTSYRDFDDIKAVLVDDYVRELEGKALDRYVAKLRSKYEVKES